MSAKGTGSTRLCGLPGCMHVHACRNRCNKHYHRMVARMKRVQHAPTCSCLDCRDDVQRHRYDEPVKAAS